MLNTIVKSSLSLPLFFLFFNFNTNLMGCTEGTKCSNYPVEFFGNDAKQDM